MHIHRFTSVLLLALLLSAGCVQNQSLPFTEAKPETVGFSTERLKRLDAAMQTLADKKQLAGIVTMLARHGKLVQQKAYGLRDITGAKPMQLDSIFKIYSMTKPVTGVAMMILYEEGKWKPGDPISKYIPEFAGLKVYEGMDSSGKMKLVPPVHAPTMGELMSHTAGFTYGYFGDTPVDKLYQQLKPLEAGSLEEFISRLAKIPLLYQPGSAWVYSVSVDIQGYLIEKLSGKSFPDFMRERIFMPLDMKDTAFFVPEGKLDRLATVYTTDEKSPDLVAIPPDAKASKAPDMPSGGGGLFSTAEDYLRFAQMMLNGGAFNGAQILSPSTVRLMRSNHLPQSLMTGKFGIGPYQMQPGLGFGYDFAVFEDPIAAGSTAGKDSHFWEGIAGTWFWIDPANDLVFIGMVQRMMNLPGTPALGDLSRALLYQALVNPEK
jgi:CubicO group peptidase (beta-lactamase class C family)